MIKCLLLVEGPFDRLRLSILKDLFDENKLVLFPFDCDKLSEIDFCINFKEDIKNILSKDKTHSIEDFDVFAQVCDLDGCFIDDKYIVEIGGIKKIQYKENAILAISRNDIIERNKIKRFNISKILERKEILLFYNSTNIDHAFDNIQNPKTNNEKKQLAMKMYVEYKSNYKKILSLLLLSNKLRSINYEKSWEDIKKDFNSLSASSNLIFFIDMFYNELKDEVKKEYDVLKNKFL